MGFWDKILRRSSDNVPEENKYEKEQLVIKILDLVDKIKRKSCFDRSISGIQNITEPQLMIKSIQELQALQGSLQNAFNRLNAHGMKQSSDAAEKARWTGKKTPGMTEHDLESWQMGD